ncbi:hypothetical protein BGZ76_007034, partial [Entomortierella beljakovae]
MVLYLDGKPSSEKHETQIRREEIRSNALRLATIHYESLEKRVENNQRVHKPHFIKISKNLRKAFYWSLDARESFRVYMIERGWNIKMCPFEADLAMAADCKPNDIVVSKDSDMLMYQNICTIWRPMSKSKMLIYDIPDVLAALGVNRLQLTLLGIVSKNDYSSNIPSLGCELNFGIVKTIKGNDVEEMLKSYLSQGLVHKKNVERNNFKAPVNVFVHLIQTPLATVESTPSAPPSEESEMEPEP